MDPLIEVIDTGFDQYQDAAILTAIYPDDAKITYPVLGLLGEVGELANKYKKVIRDGTPIDREDMASELGDALWYISAIASDLSISLGYIATTNLEKLQSRKERGVLGGSGDRR